MDHLPRLPLISFPGHHLVARVGMSTDDWPALPLELSPRSFEQLRLDFNLQHQGQYYMIPRQPQKQQPHWTTPQSQSCPLPPPPINPYVFTGAPGPRTNSVSPSATRPPAIGPILLKRPSTGVSSPTHQQQPATKTLPAIFLDPRTCSRSPVPQPRAHQSEARTLQSDASSSPLRNVENQNGAIKWSTAMSTCLLQAVLQHSPIQTAFQRRVSANDPESWQPVLDCMRSSGLWAADESVPRPQQCNVRLTQLTLSIKSPRFLPLLHSKKPEEQEQAFLAQLTKAYWQVRKEWERGQMASTPAPSIPNKSSVEPSPSIPKLGRPLKRVASAEVQVNGADAPGQAKRIRSTFDFLGVPCSAAGSVTLDGNSPPDVSPTANRSSVQSAPSTSITVPAPCMTQYAMPTELPQASAALDLAGQTELMQAFLKLASTLSTEARIQRAEDRKMKQEALDNEKLRLENERTKLEHERVRIKEDHERRLVENERYERLFSIITGEYESQARGSCPT